MINKFKKIFTVTTFTIFLMGSASCSTVVGAYSDDPYGPIVDCNSQLPIDKLLQCVDKQYAKMDKINEPDYIKRRKIFFNKLLKNTYNLNYGFKEVKVFPKLKPENSYDNSAYLKTDNFVSDIPHLRKDTYKNNTMGIYLQPSIGEIITYKQMEPVKNPAHPSYMLLAAPSVSTTKYARDYYAASKDILITKNQGRNKVYTASYEIVPLKDNKALYIIAIVNYCQHTFTKEEIQFAKKTGFFPKKDGSINYGKPIEAQTKIFDICGKSNVYFTDILDKSVEYSVSKRTNFSQGPKFYSHFVEYKSYPQKIINLSADTRENPKKLYINLNHRTFEVDINQQGTEKYEQ